MRVSDVLLVTVFGILLVLVVGLADTMNKLHKLETKLEAVTAPVPTPTKPKRVDFYACSFLSWREAPSDHPLLGGNNLTIGFLCEGEAMVTVSGEVNAMDLSSIVHYEELQKPPVLRRMIPRKNKHE